MQFQVRLFYDGHLEEKLQCPSPNVGEALSSVRGLRDKRIGPLDGFRSKAGWPFTAEMVIKFDEEAKAIPVVAQKQCTVGPPCLPTVARGDATAVRSNEKFPAPHDPESTTY